jgi:crotonobetainyl-CoA:carnitine CoA-transferase CaiB-like acyl-CoA transferase
MLAIDIRKPEGAEILRRLLRNADVSGLMSVTGTPESRPRRRCGRWLA